MGGMIMKAIDFLEEWDKNHTSQPSYQDAIDWVEKQHNIDMQEAKYELRVAIAIEKQKLINKACKWFDTRCEYPYCTEIIEGFRKYMEEE